MNRRKGISPRLTAVLKSILFDTCVPRPLRNCLAGHNVRRAQQQGWGGLKNGELLRAAEVDGFEVFVTSDKNLSYQQNLSGRQIAILVLPTNRLLFPMLVFRECFQLL